MKKFVYGLIGLVVVALVVILVGPGLWDWNDYKPEILGRIKAETGRDMTIDGDLSLAVLPSPRLAVDGVRIANIAGATAPALARFESLRVRVRLMPLLSGRIEVESVELVNPVIELEKLADGRVNWEIGPSTGEGGKDAASGAPDASGATDRPRSGGESFALDRLLIRGGRVVYRDAEAGTVETLENFNVEASAGSLAGPFGLAGGLTLRGVPLEVSASVSRFDRAGPAPFQLLLTHAAAGAKAAISGGLDMAKSALSGKIEITGKSLGGLARAVTAGKTALPPWLGQEFAFQARLAASSEGASLDEIDLRVGGTSASGGLNAVLGERTRLDAALKVKRIDLDKWLALAPNTTQGGPAGASSGNSTSPTRGAGDADDGPGGGLVLPDGIDGSIDVSVEAVGFKGRQMREIKLAAALDKGRVTLSRFSARLPGGGTASLTGTLAASGGKAQYKGKTSIRADNLRAILDWLDIDAADVPGDRLRKFQLAGKLAGDEEQVRVSDLEMRLDASRVRGGITYALRARPAFGARINVDQFNLDAYLPRRRPSSTKPATTDRPAGAPSSGENAASGGPAAPAGPLAALNGFDANLVVRVGTLNYRRTPIQGLAFDGSLVRGTLTIRRAGVRNVSGTTGRIAGTLSGFAGFPVFKGSFSASSKNVTGLFRIAGIDTPVPPRRLGRLKLSGKADGGADQVKLNTTLELAGAKISLSGQMADLGGTPRLNLDLRARHPDTARLARLLGAEIGAPKRGLGGFELGAKAKGGLDAVDLAARLAAVDAEVTFAGRITQLAASPAVAGTIEANHPDFVRLVRTFSPGYRPAKQATGPVRLSSRIQASGIAARLDDLDVRLGATSLRGAADIGLAGPKPTVSAKLTAGDIDLNTLIPVGAGGSAGAPASPAAAAAPVVPRQGKPGARRYSREPIDLSALGAYDGNVELSADSITWRTFRVDSPRLAAALGDRVLTVSDLAGKMFEGAFGLRGVLDGKQVPKLDGTVKIVRANVGKALFEAASFDIADGTLDFDMKLAAVGRSQHDLVSSLAGQGRLAVRDGTVKGFDLQAVSDRLKRLNRTLDFLSLFRSAMGGGTTRFSNLDGTMRIDKGVVRTDDLNLIANAGRGEAKGFVDLPRWNMDMQALFRLTEHPSAPPFRVRLTGPPDQADRKVDFGALQQYLVGRVVERGLGSKRLFPASQAGRVRSHRRRPRRQGSRNSRNGRKSSLKISSAACSRGWGVNRGAPAP
jgi:uncharacterized protein involved in outer membrane biogenesis